MGSLWVKYSELHSTFWCMSLEGTKHTSRKMVFKLREQLGLWTVTSHSWNLTKLSSITCYEHKRVWKAILLFKQGQDFVVFLCLSAPPSINFSISSEVEPFLGMMIAMHCIRLTHAHLVVFLVGVEIIALLSIPVEWHISGHCRFIPTRDIYIYIIPCRHI